VRDALQRLVVAGGGAGTRGEDYVKVLPWWFSSVFQQGQVWERYWFVQMQVKLSR